MSSTFSLLLPSNIARSIRGSIRHSTAQTNDSRRFSEFIEVSYDDLADEEQESGRPNSSILSRIATSFTRRNSLKLPRWARHKAASDRESLSDISLRFPLPPSHIPTPSAPLYNECVQSPARSKIQIASRAPTPKVATLRPTTNEDVTPCRPKLALEPLSELNLFSGESPMTAVQPPILFCTSFVEPSSCTPSTTTGPVVEPSCHYLTVDPTEFTASPSPLLYPTQPLLASARSSFCPPSPSWLSRNVANRESNLEDSPLPLPIPPPRLRCTVDDFSPESIDNDTLVGSSPTTSSPTSTLYFRHPAPPSPSESSHSSLETPHAFVEPYTLSCTTPKLDIYAPDFFDFSPQLSSSLSALCNLAGISLNLTSMDYTGKRNDVVDFGGEADYSNIQWFKDPPPSRTPAAVTPAPPTPANPPSNYRPSPDVIVQNEAYDYALKAAPGILYQRYKEFGELGVLAWCAEFAELIDNMKSLGYSGQMFVETRAQALKTCEDLLLLKLEIKMQIIVMFLCHQVARMRRFLDGNRVWDDYPEIEFPDPRAYGA